MGLVVPAMAEVRVGLIGVGERGVGYISHFSQIEGARIRAECDGKRAHAAIGMHQAIQ